MDRLRFEEDPADLAELVAARDELRDCEAAESALLFDRLMGKDVAGDLGRCRELAESVRSRIAAVTERLDASAPIQAQRALVAEWARVRGYDPDVHGWAWIRKYSEAFRRLWRERPDVDYVRANLYRDG